MMNGVGYISASGARCLACRKSWLQFLEPHKRSLVGTPVIPSLTRWRQNNQKFKVTLGYTADLRTAWAP